MVNELTFVEGKMSSQVDRYRFFGTASLLSLLSAVVILPSFAVYGLHILDSSTAGSPSCMSLAAVLSVPSASKRLITECTRIAHIVQFHRRHASAACRSQRY